MASRAHPLVSVVMPTCNRLHVLPSAVRSVLAEQAVGLELIVVDDASTDGTVQWLAEIDDDRLCVIPRPRRGGAAQARNCGLAAARGDIVAFLDSDDTWLQDKLALQLSAVQAAGGAQRPFLHATGFFVPQSSGSRRVGGPLREGVVPLRDVLSARSGEWSTSCFLVTRAALDLGVQFDETLAALEDQDLVAQVAYLGGQVVATTRPLVEKTPRGPDSVSSHQNLALGHLQFLEKHQGSRAWTRRSRWEHVLDAAASYAAGGETAKAAEVVASYLPALPSTATNPVGVSVLRQATRATRPRSLVAGVRRRRVQGA